MKPERKFIATYRLQLSKDFQFKDVEARLPYLKKLGISHIYLSPVFEATPGSNHGYDVSDFRKISEERGGEAQFDSLMSAAKKTGLGVLIDIVPNHMGIAGQNPYWFDVLSHGRQSRYWPLFDLRAGDDGKLSLPVLAGELDEQFSSGAIKLAHSDDLGYHWDLSGRALPINSDGQNSIAAHTEAGTKGPGSVSISTLKEVLRLQHYTLDHWTKMFDGLTYRRFFDVTDLIGVRIEDPEIYAMTHQGIFDLAERYDVIDGIRVDHVDGLADPTGYIHNLSHKIPNVWIEKILTGDEELPDVWNVNGTTGYEFIRQVNGLMINPDNYKKLDDFWRKEFSSEWDSFSACVAESKRQMLESLFASELNRLVDLSAKNGLDPEKAKYFWTELTVNFPRYRSYFGEDAFLGGDLDVIEKTVEKAFPQDDRGEIGEFVRLVTNPSGDLEKQIVREWQQITGPVTAKGLEDTAHYRYTPLCAMNEVGCEPAFEPDLHQGFWDWMNKRSETYPLSLLASSTHDTKRSEDVRARLYALGARPEEWIDSVRGLLEQAQPLLQKYGVTPEIGHFLFQNMVASIPQGGVEEDDFIPRMQAYMVKAAKERKRRTSWIKPDEEYEKNIQDFVQAVCGDADLREALESRARELDWRGRNYSLACTALKLLGPGIPDIYQGCENWNYSLVDPDNRRPVDFFKNERLLEEIGDSLSGSGEGEAKIYLTRKLLAMRSNLHDGPWKYRELAPTDLMLAFEIAAGDQNLVVLCRLEEGAKPPRLTGDYRDMLEPRVIASADIEKEWKKFPVMVLSPV